MAYLLLLMMITALYALIQLYSKEFGVKKKEQREEGSTPQPEPKPVAAKKIELSDAEVDRVINRYSERLSEVGRMNSKQCCTAA
eukprot:SAG31_NODE_155_length_22130_cov_9.540098_8_plen_84_part_00